MKTSIKELRCLVARNTVKDFHELTEEEQAKVINNRQDTIAYATGIYGTNAVLQDTCIGLVAVFGSDIYKTGI